MTTTTVQTFELTSAPDFQAAVTYAKVIATSIGKTELNPALLRGGFLALLESNATLTELELSTYLEPLKDSCIGITRPPSIGVQNTNSTKLPISGRLKQLLSEKYKSVAGFVDTLLEDGSGINDADVEIFQKVVARASGFSKHTKSESPIDGERLGLSLIHI